jgi:hypothetical protein
MVESCELTALSLNVPGFINISDKLDSKQASQKMNEYLTLMTQIIHSNRSPEQLE